MKLLLGFLLALIPLLGAWVASSIAAYHHGPIWVSALVGALLLLLLPLLWEAWSKPPEKRPRFGLVGRLVIRTLVLNLLFIATLVATIPELVFTALSMRGDWMLERSAGRFADTGRGVLHRLANGLEWAYRGARDNPFAKYADRSRRPEPEPAKTTIPPPPVTPPSVTQPDGGEGAGLVEAVQPKAEAMRRWERKDDGRPVWPMQAGLHPAVQALKPEQETDLASVAKALVAGEPDPYQRVKALHDYVADRVVYDVESYLAQKYPPQDAETVFKTRRSVCAGYSNLLAAMGTAAGEDIIVVGGDARTPGQSINGDGHAWNAAKILGRWYLIDATWDAGGLDSSQSFKKIYRTIYFLTPPELFAINHFPDDAAWQLMTEPMSRGDFMRQPMMSAQFYALGSAMISPTRSQIDARGQVELVIANPRAKFFLAEVLPRDGAAKPGADCRVLSDAGTVRVECPLPAAGTYRVMLFGGAEKYGSAYEYVGELEVNSRG